jgi:hypothetical protein
MTKLQRLINDYDPEKSGPEYFNEIIMEALLLDRKCLNLERAWTLYDNHYGRNCPDIRPPSDYWLDLAREEIEKEKLNGTR